MVTIVIQEDEMPDDVRNNATDPDSDEGTWDAADSVSGELHEASDVPEQAVSEDFDEGTDADEVDRA